MKGIFLLAGAAALGLVAACGGGQSLDEIQPERGVTAVAVRDNRFDPRVIEVPSGTEVTWRWEGDAPHNVKSDGFTSETIRKGTFTRTFDAPGAYDFHCTLHPGMSGRVVVNG